MQNLISKISRKEALKQGLKQYYTGKICSHNHLCNRYVANFGCVICRGEDSALWIKNNPERIKELKRNSHFKNYENYKEKKASYYIANKKTAIIALAKLRAYKKGLDFNINADDLDWPIKCPVLGIDINYAVRGKTTHNSPTLDRFDNLLGYVIGNVDVISFRANRLKSDATNEEIKFLADYFARKCGV